MEKIDQNFEIQDFKITLELVFWNFLIIPVNNFFDSLLKHLLEDNPWLFHWI